MQTRQTGAAHVPLIYVLILLLLFLGAVAFAYVTATDNAKLKQDTAAAKDAARVAHARNLKWTHYAEDTGKVIKLPGKYEGRTGVDYEGASLDDIVGLTDHVALKQKLDAFATQCDVVGFNGIEPVMGAVVAKIESYKQRIKDLEKERDTVQTEKQAVDANFVKAGADHTAAEKQLSDQITQVRADLTSQVNAKDASLATVTQGLRDKNDELAAAKEAALVEKKKLVNEINNLRAQNTALVSRIQLVRPPDVADGKIIGARNNVTTAFADLGRKDMLQPGTVFRVKNPKSDKFKAYATVTRVEQERCELQLSGVVDPVGDAVREGDQLFSDIYSPNSKRTIFLMGRFSYPYHKPDLEQLLRRLGNDVVTKMGPGVDLVLLGNDAQNEAGDGFTAVAESAEYKEAVNLGVEFAPLQKIRDLIKLQ
ncbi:MAG TPA: hypothetical protein VK348_03100, partial [Planctomycetota bacterium]|nr:hypothetical protein [Planctomycetota bacterium]